LRRKKYDTGATTRYQDRQCRAYSGPASAYGVIGKTEDAYFKMITTPAASTPQDQFHLL